MATLLKHMPQLMVRSYTAGHNLLMLGKPGIGKTCTIEMFVERMQERLPEFLSWRFYGPTMSPMDIQASMPDNETKTLKVYSNAGLPNAYASGGADLKGVVFIGEMLNTDPTTLKLLQKYVNGEDMNGVLKKPAGVMIVADSNRMEDKAGVLQQFRALLNRFMTIDVYTDADSNIEYAAKQAWSPLVQAFFRENPAQIDNYEKVFGAAKEDAKTSAQYAEEGKRGIWASMRGWNRVSDLEYAVETLGGELTNDEIIGSVGTGPGMLYIAFKKVVDRLATIEQVIADPKTVPIPQKIDELYALCTIVALRCKVEDLAAVYEFSQRVPADMMVYLMKTVISRKLPAIFESPVFTKWARDPKVNKLVAGV